MTEEKGVIYNILPTCNSRFYKKFTEEELAVAYLKGEAELSGHNLGHDSEFFLWDTKKEEVVSAHRYYKPQEQSPRLYVERKKFKARYVKETIIPGGLDWYGNRMPDRLVRQTPKAMLSGYTTKIYRDGLAAEVGVSPVSCRAFMWNDTKFTLLKYEPPRRPDHIIFTTRPYVTITKEMMADFPEDLKVLGCSPSRNAYIEDGLVEQQIAVDPMNTFFRTCGSHLHRSFAGHDSSRPLPKQIWAKFIALTDLIIGVPFAYLFNDQLEAQRRQLYGRAGEFRYQPSYGGLEYRVLSSRLWDHPASYSFFTGIWKYILGGSGLSAMFKAYDPKAIPEIQEAINLANRNAAKKLLPLAQKVLEVGRASYTFGLPTKTPFPLREILDMFVTKKDAGEIRDCRIWSDPFMEEGHTGFCDYARRWKLAGLWN